MRRAEEDFAHRIDEKRVELERAEATAAIEAYERSLTERTSAAERFAAAAQAAIAAVREYEATNERVVSAWKAVLNRRVGPESVKAEGEPAVVAESFEMLIDIVRPRLDSDLERDLVDAAARSPMGHQIKKLPAHLQVLARERREAIFRDTASRQRREP
jgi:hypothetical protein